MKLLPITLFTALLLLPGNTIAKKIPNFSFQNITTIEEMHQFISDTFQVGSTQKAVRKIFIEAGKATLIGHPSQANVEKYIYDINICRIYIWRWNISADYNEQNKLLQIYLNGNPILSNGTPKKIVSKKAKNGKKANIYRTQRPRPEADKGENSIEFILFDGDSDPNTIDDQAAIGAGPSRLNATNMGQAIIYRDVEPWRSIFDMDPAKKIHPFEGSCQSNAPVSTTPRK